MALQTSTFKKGTHSLTVDNIWYYYMNVPSDETMCTHDQCVLVFLQPKSNRGNPLQPVKVKVTVNSNRRIPLQPRDKVVSQYTKFD